MNRATPRRWESACWLPPAGSTAVGGPESCWLRWLPLSLSAVVPFIVSLQALLWAGASRLRIRSLRVDATPKKLTHGRSIAPAMKS
jgi:hypothetical protein